MLRPGVSVEAICKVFSGERVTINTQRRNRGKAIAERRVLLPLNEFRADITRPPLTGHTKSNAARALGYLTANDAALQEMLHLSGLAMSDATLSAAVKEANDMAQIDRP